MGVAAILYVTCIIITLWMILLIIQLFYERNVFARCGKNAAEHDDITPNTAAVIGCLAVTSSQWDEAVYRGRKD